MSTFKRCAEISSHTEEMSGATTPQRVQSVSFLTETEKRQKVAKNTSENCMETKDTKVAVGLRSRDLFLCTFPQPCLGETEIEHHCVTKMNTVTNSQPQDFAAPKHAVKPDEDANRDVETSLYPRESCKAKDDIWRDWCVRAGAFPADAMSSIFSKHLECAHATAGRSDARWPKCIQLEKGHLQLPTTLLRTMKVPHPSPMLCRARFYQIRPKSERNSTSFVDNVPWYQCQLPNLSSCLFPVAQCVLPLIFFHL